jgi:hypothetical protein
MKGLVCRLRFLVGILGFKALVDRADELFKVDIHD